MYQKEKRKRETSSALLFETLTSNSNCNNESTLIPTFKTQKRKTISDVNVEEDINRPQQLVFAEISKYRKQCKRCGMVETPRWRRALNGYGTLCNSCGLKWVRKPITIVKKKPSSQDFKKSHQKQYTKHSRYPVKTRLDSKDPARAFKINLSIRHGQLFMSKAKEYELPADNSKERDLSREPFFTTIRSNIFVERKPQHWLDEHDICNCLPPTKTDQFGCGEDCINSVVFECDPKCCPCGTKCSNQRFQRKEREKGLQVFQTDHRGWGLRTNVDIKKEDVVIEYCGEIISRQLCEERMFTTYINEKKNFYFLDYGNGEVIDAGTKGTEARFINHGCDPNCHIEKWSLKGESHIGVFASKDIDAHTELFYDYNFSTFNGSVESQQTCHCGSSLCRGTIEKRARLK